jgi:D-alanine-D-alanine ligase
MDKLRTKRLLQGAGLPTPRYCVIRNQADLVEAAEQLGWPVMVKPADEGSSIGMSKVARPDQVQACTSGRRARRATAGALRASASR